MTGDKFEINSAAQVLVLCSAARCAGGRYASKVGRIFENNESGDASHEK